MKISLGFSPCPNDTFIFDAMVHGKIDTEGLSFEVVLADVEALNHWAFEGRLDVTKLSFHAYTYLTDRYNLLESGAALGNNCGPLLIARRPMPEEAINNAVIAIPGKYTTANFLLSQVYPQAVNRQVMVFSAIEDAVLSGEVDAGLIIHENRFTYQDKGLVKLADLGEIWEQNTGLPIPLGGIAVKNELPPDLQAAIGRVMTRSVTFAMDNPTEALPFVRAHSQEMDEGVMYAHINLYVNEFTRALGERGHSAVARMRATGLTAKNPGSA
ncbi:MAG: 1,4-dihydroxy-6-naphthoate synthase [Saprospiraceae bacterium]|nr:1,4-dihydroxy-6-naphthoate synthase [Saprospiraceae bacterium]